MPEFRPSNEFWPVAGIAVEKTMAQARMIRLVYRMCRLNDIY